MKYSSIFFFGFLFTALFLPRSIKAAPDSSQKQKAYLNLRYIREDGLGKVHFKLYTLEDNKRTPVRFSIVNLFLVEESKWGMMGNITSDANGEGEVTLRDRFANESKGMTEYQLSGSMNNDPRLFELQKFVNIKPATLELSLFQQDSVRYAKATLNELDSPGVWVPVSGVSIAFNVKKYYTLLPSVTTDEKGEALLEIPNGLKGDSLGNVKIVAKVDASDKYGTLIATGEKKWGVPDQSAGLLDKLLSISLIAGVWAVIIYIVSKLFRKYSAQSAQGK